MTSWFSDFSKTNLQKFSKYLLSFEIRVAIFIYGPPGGYEVFSITFTTISILLIRDQVMFITDLLYYIL